MKRCPQCRKDYVDDSLLYCLDDGAALVQGSVTDEPATAILSGDVAATDRPTEVLGVRATTEKRSQWRPRVPWILAALGILAAAFFGLAYTKDSSSTANKAIRLSFDVPPELSFNNLQPDWAVISPDGQKIAFTAIGADQKNRLYYRDLDSNETKLLPGSENPLEPFWSPDSKSIAYG